MNGEPNPTDTGKEESRFLPYRTSMEYWWPKIKDLGVPVPKTELLLHKNGGLLEWVLYMDKPLPEDEVLLLKETAAKIGYPVFMRSDVCSGKHNFVNTCFVKKEKDLIPHLGNLIEDNAIRDLPMSCIALRRFVLLDSKFTAFADLPIAPERRYFVSDGVVQCHHPYWPMDAIEFRQGYRKADRTWSGLLYIMNKEAQDEVRLLTGYASLLGQKLGGDWSFDFAKTKAGQWIFIDAAWAVESYHDPNCPNQAGQAGIAKEGPRSDPEEIPRSLKE
jgi:hypothetical protein